MGTSGNLEKMILASYTDDSFTSQASQMSVYMNPESYTHRYKILYNAVQAPGSAGSGPEYNLTPSDEVQFQLVFDGTGVVPNPVPGSSPPAGSGGIVTQVNQFLQLAFTFDGNIHSPNYIQVLWGTLVFNCRLSTLNLTYTLFQPDGTPLRAKADVTFIGFQNQQEIAKEENAQSPDLSHVVTVRGGDTLPLLCYNIYGKSGYYSEVARINGMTGFRQLIPGEKILFPPLTTATQ